MNRQLKIRAGAPLKAALYATGNGNDEFPTGRVNAVCERYLAMIEAARPALSRAEWLAICDALSGVGMADVLAADDLAALDEPARIAVVETAQRFWALSGPDDTALDMARTHPARWPSGNLD